jgi:hypothetical protein
MSLTNSVSFSVKARSASGAAVVLTAQSRRGTHRQQSNDLGVRALKLEV